MHKKSLTKNAAQASQQTSGKFEDTIEEKHTIDKFINANV